MGTSGRGGSATGPGDERAPGVLVLVQNLSVPTDRRVWTECQELRRAGYRVDVICPRAQGQSREFDLEGVRVHTYRLPEINAGAAGYLVEFVYAWVRTALLAVHVARTRGFRVVQACNPPDTYWLLARLMRPFGVRFVYDQHDLCPEIFEVRFGRRGLLHRGLRALERATYRSADRVVSTNETYRAVAIDRGGVPPERVSVVMSAPDPARMRPQEEVPDLRRGREHLACYLGIMGAQDGVDVLLRSIGVYVHEMGRADCHFALMGFGDRLHQLESLADDLALREFVEFTGRVELPQITRWLSTANVGLTPDPKNAFNDRSTMNKTLEYMAFGVPVLSFDLHETMRVLDGCGVAVEGDERAYAKALSSLLDDPEQREELGSAGRRRVEQELSWQRQAQTYVRVFDELTRDGDPPAPR